MSCVRGYSIIVLRCKLLLCLPDPVLPLYLHVEELPHFILHLLLQLDAVGLTFLELLQPSLLSCTVMILTLEHASEFL